MEMRAPDLLTRTAMALRERLQLALPPRQFLHEFLPARLDAGVWKQLVTKTPFVGLGFNTLDHDKGAREFIGSSKWTVFLVVKNSASGFGPRYLGDSLGAGLFAVTCAAVAVLQGMTIPGVGSVLVRSAGNAFVEGWDAEHMAMAALDVQVGATLSVPSVFDVEPEKLDAIDITWNFDGGQINDTFTEACRP